MNVFVMVDMEGISGICKAVSGHPRASPYQTGRKLPDHGRQRLRRGLPRRRRQEDRRPRRPLAAASTSSATDLDPRAEYIQGSTGPRAHARHRDFDGLILLGYHAMAGTPEAILEHTMSSRLAELLDQRRQERRDWPSTPASPATTACRSSWSAATTRSATRPAEFFKDVVTVQVKKGLDVEGGQLLSAGTSPTTRSARAAQGLPRVQALQALQGQEARDDAAGTGLPRQGPRPSART